MDDTTPQALFAGRYRFIDPPDDDWDIGRSGFAQPAIDKQQADRLVVIKHTDPTSPHADRHEQSLQNEAQALKALQGMGVPNLYSDDQAEYGSSRRFTYLVMEYIDGLRVEKDFYRLEPVEHAYIITELLRLIAIAHSQGIVNGDIDLKHLFWRREQKQLVVIDWGNANLGVEPLKNSLFAYDLARCAEIIYALVTRRGIAHPTGSLALPAELYPGLAPLPDEFYTLCAWAPRNPTDEIRTTLTALGLYQAAKQWLQRLEPAYKPDDSLLYRPPIPSDKREGNQPKPKRSLIPLIFILILLIGLALLGRFVLGPLTVPISTSTLGESTPPAITSIQILTKTNTPETGTPSELPTTPTVTASATVTVTPFFIPAPGNYSDSVPISLQPACSTRDDGLQFRPDDNTWQFRISAGHEANYRVETDLSQCNSLDAQSLKAISLYAYAFKIAPESEFGFFLEYSDGTHLEYTLWADEYNFTYLKLRESNAEPINQKLLLIPPTPFPNLLSKYYQYSVMMFLEITDNSNILYLNPGRGFTTMKPENISPSQMIRMDNVTIAIPDGINLKRFGLVGYGSDVQVLLLPLSFYIK